jgi:signal transduction histidine kinase
VLGSVVGAIALAAKGGRELRECALEVTDELAQRVSLALENERLHRGALDALHARDEFLAVASHELRGPIAALHVAVQTFLKTRDPAQQARLRSIIERADLRIAGLADDILDASEIRGGRLRLDLEPIDLGVVAREAISRASGELARSGSTLTTQVRGPLVGTWDRHRIAQVVANLLSNAIKFGRGRPIEVVLEGDASRARLSITDHGDGIPKDRIDAIFEPFERAVADRHYGGLGLGLCIAKSIVEGLGGSIEVASEPDRVTTFTVTLPKAKEAKAA